MKTSAKHLLLAAKLLALVAALGTTRPARATPSTTFWTPATTYVQPFLVPHLTYDTYFKADAAYPIDTGLTIGVLPFEKLQAEVGFDLFLPSGAFENSPQLNAKLGVPEGAFGAWQPGLSGGIYGVGFKSNVSNFNILHAEVSKTIGPFGTLVAGGYYGLTEALFVSDLATGARGDRAGVMGAYISPDLNIGLPALHKLNLAVDGMSGSNAFGAVGAGLGIFFTPAINLLTGPVFFLESRAQPNGASWMWSMQIDVDVDFLAKPQPSKT
jgi:hypothetical protein